LFIADVIRDGFLDFPDLSAAAPTCFQVEANLCRISAGELAIHVLQQALAVGM
jgi:hypothetical protein